jgi:hypothetical protein
MVPIHQILREIKLAFGTNDVSLPKNTNEFRMRMPWRGSNSETKIDPDDDEKGLIVSSPPTQSIRTIDDLDKKVTDSDTLSPQIQQDSLPNPSVHPYKMILSKMKEESEPVSTTACTNPPPNALGSTAAHDINATSALCDTLSEQQDPESCVPSAQIEPKPSASRATVLQTRARGSQYRLATDTVDKIKRPGVFILGGSSGDDGSSYSDSEGSVTDWRFCEAKQSSLANSQRNKHLSSSKNPSFKEIVQSRRMEEVDCEDEDAVESDCDGDGDVSESAIEEDDVAWEDSDSESERAGPVDNDIFCRVEPQANLTSQRSMLTMQLHNPQRNTTLANGASRSSPTLHRSCTPSSAGPSHPGSSDKTGVEPLPTIHGLKSGPAMSIICTTINTHPHLDSPKTIRRNMRSIELSESLRKSLLWERRQTSTIATAFLKRRHTAQNIAHLQKYPDIKPDPATAESPKNNFWNDYFAGPWEYHAKEW